MRVPLLTFQPPCSVSEFKQRAPQTPWAERAARSSSDYLEAAVSSAAFASAMCNAMLRASC
jgi:hypothetical protein